MKTVETGTATPERAKAVRWYEEEKCQYEVNQIVDISASQLQGRQAQVTRPSAKKHAIKAFLINPKDGSLQGTEVTLNYSDVKLADHRKTPEEYKAEAESKKATKEPVSESASA
jgi:hypothetical protein